jgi:CheY-like chemotaxis protein
MNTPDSAQELPASSSDSARLLVVDDEPGVLALATAILSSAGYTVLTAMDGNAAVEALQVAGQEGDPVRCIVLDLTLPGGPSGFETLEAIHARHSEMPVIACSGYFQEDSRELCTNLGFCGVLAKPYTADGLVTVVRRALLSSSAPAC